jgi:hypothetical protein
MDRAGVRALHRAATANAADAVALLLGAGANPSVQTLYGSTPLHLAAAAGATRAWRALTATGADADGIQDHWGRSAADVARMHGWAIQPANIDGGPSSATATELVAAAPSTSDRAAASSRHLTGDDISTAVLTHPSCMRHYTCPPSEAEQASVPPENVRRLKVLLDGQSGALQSADISGNIRWLPEARAAALSDVLRVHEWQYIRQMQVS